VVVSATAFARVAGNRGRNTPGVDGVTFADIEQGLGMSGFPDQLCASLKDGSFVLFRCDSGRFRNRGVGQAPQVGGFRPLPIGWFRPR
jgi:hypothetical protein